jgi:hypothetical protein
MHLILTGIVEVMSNEGSRIWQASRTRTVWGRKCRLDKVAWKGLVRFPSEAAEQYVPRSIPRCLYTETLPFNLWCTLSRHELSIHHVLVEA